MTQTGTHGIPGKSPSLGWDGTGVGAELSLLKEQVTGRGHGTPDRGDLSKNRGEGSMGTSGNWGCRDVAAWSRSMGGDSAPSSKFLFPREKT